MKYSIYIITAFLFGVTSLFSLVELEEVLQIYPNGGTSDNSKVYLNGDTILVNTNLSTQNNNYDLLLSTDRGNSWLDITEKMQSTIGDKFQEKLFSELGSYYLYVNRKDTTLDYYNLDGNIIEKVEPMNKSLRDVEIVLNPLDENFLGHFYNYFEFHHHMHFQSFSTSIDRGKSWSTVNPVPEMEAQGKGGGAGPLTISYGFSNGFKDCMFFFFDWGDVYRSYGAAHFSYNTNSEKVELLQNRKNNGLCLECTGKNELLVREVDSESFRIFDYLTGEYQSFPFVEKTIGWDADSLTQFDDKEEPIDYYERLLVSGRTTNLRSPNHQIMELTHYKYDNRLAPYVYDFVHQYYFQTFDFGESWELIYKNTDKNNLIKNFKINPSDKVFWVIKGEQIDSDYRSDTKKPILYKSKEALTSVEDSYNSTGMKVSLNDSKLSITSEEFQSNVSLRIFNLEGKELQSINLNLNKGLNEININKTNEKLLFISIEMKGNSNQIYKLLNNN